MDVSSLYTNIDQEEGAEGCFKKLEERKNNSISPIVIKNLILTILKSNAFPFGNESYRQITTTAIEQNFLRDYSQKTGSVLSPLVWFCFINDIFFIWTCNKDSLGNFISSTQNYSKFKNMKSRIKFEIRLSTKDVHFLDLTVSLKHKNIRTTLFTKPTDSQFYLNTLFCHPSHVLRNIPKGQFI